MINLKITLQFQNGSDPLLLRLHESKKDIQLQVGPSMLTARRIKEIFIVLYKYAVPPNYGKYLQNDLRCHNGSNVMVLPYI